MKAISVKRLLLASRAQVQLCSDGQVIQSLGKVLSMLWCWFSLLERHAWCRPPHSGQKRFPGSQPTTERYNTIQRRVMSDVELTGKSSAPKLLHVRVVERNILLIIRVRQDDRSRFTGNYPHEMLYAKTGSDTPFGLNDKAWRQHSELESLPWHAHHNYWWTILLNNRCGECPQRLCNTVFLCALTMQQMRLPPRWYLC